MKGKEKIGSKQKLKYLQSEKGSNPRRMKLHRKLEETRATLPYYIGNETQKLEAHETKIIKRNGNITELKP